MIKKIMTSIAVGAILFVVVALFSSNKPPSTNSGSYHEVTNFSTQGVRVTVFTDGNTNVYVTSTGNIAVK